MDVYAAFLSATSDLLEDHILNRLAAQTAPPVPSKLGPKVHVELLFCPTKVCAKSLDLGHARYADTPTASGEVRQSRFSATESSDELKGIACSIHYGGKCFVHKDKGFSRTSWEFRKLRCSEAQAQKCLAFMREHEGDGFNKAGFFTEPVRRRLSCVPNLFQPTSALQMGEPKWFCSELVEAALRGSGIVEVGMTTPSAHPEILFQELKCLSVPSAPIERGSAITF